MEKLKEGMLKWTLLFIVSLGLSLSMMFGWIYHCEGSEVMPEYFASPFVFKKSSLASSMEYFYSISGLLLNTITWAICLSLIDLILLRMIQKMKEARMFERIYFVLKLGPFLLALFFIFLSVLELGIGLDNHSNCWRIDMQEEAKTWGAACEQKWVLFFEELSAD